MERRGLCCSWRPYRGHRDQTKVTGGQIQEHRDQRGEKGLRSIFGECIRAGGGGVTQQTGGGRGGEV